MIQKINDALGMYDNIGVFISLTISLIALIIAIISFRISSNKAKLFLKYQVYGYESEYIYYENENGKMVFASEEKNSTMVTICRPGGETNLIIENRGKVAAKNPVLNFRFINMGFNYNPVSHIDWNGIVHNHGIGTWQEIRWQPANNTVIHPGIPIQFNCFCFNNSEIFENASIEVIISADNANCKKFRIPIEIKTAQELNKEIN